MLKINTNRFKLFYQANLLTHTQKGCQELKMSINRHSSKLKKHNNYITQCFTITYDYSQNQLCKRIQDKQVIYQIFNI